MKKIALTIGLLLIASLSYAQGPVKWVSKGTSNPVIVGSGDTPADVEITVDGGPNASGVTIKNCGTTTSIKPGSSATCGMDPHGPPTFSADNPNLQATGTYTISSTK